MNITASMVKELRERTGSGMMECKKALVEASGDMDTAIDQMRKSGLAKADKKAGRTAAEGCVIIKVSDDAQQAAMIEINCETDFVANGDDFSEFAQGVAGCVLDSEIDNLDSLLKMPLASGSVDDVRRALVAKLGEKIDIRRFERFSTESGVIGSYIHGGRIGVLTELSISDAALARDIAMHVAASKPVCVDDSGVDESLITKEKEIFSSQALESGKPPEIIEKMIVGRLKKFLAEITLLGQSFVKDPDVSVGSLLQSKNASVVQFARFEVGEGIEKKEENFAEEVMAQVRSN